MEPSADKDVTTLEVVPVRHVGRWVASGIVLLGLAMLVHTLFSRIPSGLQSCSKDSHGIQICHELTKLRFQWNFVGQYFTSSQILRGLLLTLQLTVLTMIVGVTLGVIVAVMRLSPNRILSSVAWSFTWFFRGTPVLVQLIFWYNISAIFPTASIGIPFGPAFWHLNLTALFTPFVAVLVGLLEERDVPHLVGKSWTTDAFYRESRPRIDRRVAEGCLTVEMEAAAFMAVARFRGVRFAQLLYAGDSVAGATWDARGWNRASSIREALFDLALEGATRL